MGEPFRPGVKLGGQSKLRLFLKGNDDLVGSLLPVEKANPGGAIRELVRSRCRGACDLELTHESCARSDLLLQQIEADHVPDEVKGLAAQGDGGTAWADMPTRLGTSPVDICVLSLEPDIGRALWRHRETGYLVDPPARWGDDWPAPKRAWFADRFEPVGQIPVEQWKEKFIRLVRILKERTGAHIIVYNCSTFDPGDRVHNYRGVEGGLGLRAHRFNLALIEISALEGISIIDVDRLIGEAGAGRHVLAPLRYSAGGFELIRAEFLRVLEDIGFFESRPLVMQVGQAR